MVQSVYSTALAERAIEKEEFDPCISHVLVTYICMYVCIQVSYSKVCTVLDIMIIIDVYRQNRFL